MRQLIFFLASLLLLAVAGFAFLLIDTVPPTGLTHARMHGMKRRILRFACTHGALPTKIEQLPRIPGMDNRLDDGWGKPIRFRIEGDKVILTSYGRDAKPGGAGEDSDMIAVFQAKTEARGWADEFCEWEIDPYGRKGK